MRKTMVCAALLLAALNASAAKKFRDWQTAKVVYQNLSSSQSGAAIAPIGTMAVAVPLYRSSNAVVVETSAYRYEWSEAVQRGALILPVNGYVRFYRDGNWFIVLDSKQKKHKFALVGMTALQAEQ